MINIVGAGLSGLSAAITLAEKGIKCNLISVQPSERAQSVLAEGGINAALDTMGENDSVDEHLAETLKGGVYLENENTVRGLVKAAPSIIKKFEKIGVPFNYENNKLVLRNFGGQKKKRTAYTKSTTGKSLMTALSSEARRFEAQGFIFRYPHHEFIKLDKIQNECKGLFVRDIYSGEILYFEGAVLIACGGLSGFFQGLTTGSAQNTGNVQATLFCQGVEFCNLEFIQYHPTAVNIPDKKMLISEAARGEGGRLFTIKDGQRFYFMESKYPELKNLMPRDVVSRECYFAIHDPKTDGKVYLDMTGLEKRVWTDKLSDLREEIICYLGIDPASMPVEVSPAMHYFMGGIAVDINHRTKVKGLYASGECAAIYHGANRLGGNSLLGAVYGGQIAAASIFDDHKGKEEGKTSCVSSGRTNLGYSAAEEFVSASHAKRQTSVLSEGLGIVRDKQSITDAIKKTDELLRDSFTDAEFARAMFGKAMLISALGRTESRGAHYRLDYPNTSEEFRKKSIVKFCNGDIELDYIPV